MKRHVIGTATVKGNVVCEGRMSGVRTTIPKCAYAILEVEKPEFLRWEKHGEYHCVYPCEYNDPGAMATRRDGYRITVPNDMARDMGLEDGSTVIWYVGLDKGKWGIHAEVAKDE